MIWNKQTFLAFLFMTFFGISQVLGQNEGVGINAAGDPPDSSAMLDVSANTKGVLIPRMSLSDRNNISDPAHSLLIYQTDNNPGYYYHDTTTNTWTRLAEGKTSLQEAYGAGNQIQLNGADPFLVQSNGGNALFNVLNNGNVGIGNSSPAADLDVTGKITTDTLTSSEGFIQDTLTVNGGAKINALLGRFGIFRDSLKVSNKFQFNSGSVGAGNVLTSFDAKGQAQWTSQSTLDDGDWTTSGNYVFNSDDSIGIGTTSPSADLDIRGGRLFNKWTHAGDFEANIQVRNSSAGAVPGLSGGTRGIYALTGADDASTKYSVTGKAAGNSGEKYGVYGVGYGEGGTNIGIYGTTQNGGSATNWAGYFDNGNVFVGDSVKTEGEYKYSNPRNRELPIGAADFTRTRIIASSGENPVIDSAVHSSPNGTGADTLMAPVHLPNGAKLLQLVFHYIDNVSNGDLSMELIRRDRGNTSVTTITGFFPGGADGDASDFANVTTNQIIDNVQYKYYIRLIIEKGYYGDLALETIELDYDVSKAD